MNKTIYLTDEEHAYVEKQGKGYVRTLVQADMALTEPEKVKRVKKKIGAVADDPLVEVTPTQMIVQVPHTPKEPIKKIYNTGSPKQTDNTNTCKKCGHILSVGKCVNPECKK